MLRDNGERRTILMIDYLFPPIAGPGIQRTLGYVRHLRHCGWEPIVLTVRDGEHSFQDVSLLDRIPSDVGVERTRSLEPVRFIKRFLVKGSAKPLGVLRSGHPLWSGSKWVTNIEHWLLFPDRRIGWLPFALARAFSLNRRRPFDVIYSSSTNMMTGHLIAYLLKRYLRKPWVADLQDAWLESYVSYFPSRLHKRAAERLERLVLQEADRVTVATEAHRQMLVRRYGELPREKFHVVPMGLDPYLFEGIRRTPSPRFTITHFGNFYSSRSPGPFLAAIAQCAKEGEDVAAALQVVFLGTFDREGITLTEKMIKEYGLENIVHLPGLVPYKVGLQQLISSDVLLLVTDEGVWGRVLLASKLLEYLAARRPILALVPDGATADLVRAANAGIIVSPSDVEAIKNAITQFYRLWRAGRLTFRGDPEFIGSLSWREITRKFASILEQSIPGHTPLVGEG